MCTRFLRLLALSVLLVAAPVVGHAQGTGTAQQDTTAAPEANEAAPAASAQAPQEGGQTAATDQPESAVEEETTEAIADALTPEEAAALEAATSEANEEEEAEPTAAETAAEQEAVEAAQESGAVVENLDALHWSGAWRSFWRDGQALLTIEQNGTRVTGTYQPGDGTIEGEVDGVLLKGTWRQENSDGVLEFAMAPDGSSFVGRFGNGEYWNGVRITDGTLTTALFGRENPEAAFASFISSMNAARDGDALAEILLRRYVSFAGEDEGDARIITRRLNLMGDLLDMATFRVNRVVMSDTEGLATNEMEIAGTTYRFPINITQTGDEEWGVEVPTMEQLEAIEARVLEATETTSLEELQAQRQFNPRQAMHDFINGTAEWHTGGRDVALGALDLSDIPETLRATDGPIAAEYILQIIDRLGVPLFQEIPNDPDRQRPLKVYENAGGELLIHRVEQEEGPARWLFSPQSLQAAPAVFQVMQNLPLADGVRASEPLTSAFVIRQQIGELSPDLLSRGYLLENWQWVALGGAVLIGLVLALTVAVIIRIATSAVMSIYKASPEARADVMPILRWPLWMFVLGLFLSSVLRTIGLRQDISEIANIVAGTLLIVGGTFVVYNLVRAISNYLARQARNTEGKVDDIAAILGGGIAKFAVLIGGVVLLSELFELPYEGVIAALGVGGLAFGFAARDAVANLISAGILMADRPFKKGDFVEVGGVTGTVEQVGMRSTRLRTIDDALVVLPNAQISEGQVNNMGQRRRRRVTMTLGMTYDSPREKLEEFIKRLHVMMEEDPDVLPNPWIHLDNFGAYSIDISIIAYLRSPDLVAYLQNKHDLIANILDMAKEIGIEFAFPTQTIHVAPTEEAAVDLKAA